MSAKVLRDMQCNQPLLAVSAARSYASSLRDVNPDALGPFLLAKNSPQARSVLLDATACALMDGAYGGATRIEALMLSVSHGISAVVGNTDNCKGVEEIARLVASALVGIACDEPFCRNCPQECDKNWLASILESSGRINSMWRKRFWSCLTAEAGQGSLIAMLKKKNESLSADCNKFLWTILWNTVNNAFADNCDKEVGVYYAMRVVRIVDGINVCNEAVLTIVEHVKSIKGVENVPYAVRLLTATEQLIGCDRKTLVDTVILMICRCIDVDDLHHVRDILSLIPDESKMLSDVQKYELALLCSFLVVTTGGALGHDVIRVLNVVAPNLQCRFVAELVQCALIIFLFAAQQPTSGGKDAKSIAEALLSQIEEQIKSDLASGSKGNCVCHSEPSFSNSEVIQKQLNAPLALSLMSISRYLCTVENSNDEDYVAWLQSLASKLKSTPSFQPMLLFFMLPTLLPTRSPKVLDESISVIGGAITKHGEQAFSLLPLYLNLLASHNLTSSNVMKLLEVLPTFAVYKRAVPVVVRVLLPIAQQKGLYPTVLRSFTNLWNICPETFSFLVRVLQLYPVTELDGAGQVACAFTALEICSRSINRGLNIVHVANSLINEKCDPIAIRMAISVLALLCDADELDYSTTWGYLKSKLQSSKDSSIRAGLIRFAGCASKYDVPPNPTDSASVQFVKYGQPLVEEAFTFIQSQMNDPCPEVRSAALHSITMFSTDRIQTRVISEELFQNVVKDPNKVVRDEGIEIFGRVCAEEASLRDSSAAGKKAKSPVEQRFEDIISNTVVSEVERKLSSCKDTVGTIRQALSLAQLFVTAYRASADEPQIDVMERFKDVLHGLEITPVWSLVQITFSAFCAFFSAQVASGSLFNSDGERDINALIASLTEQQSVSPAKAMICAMAAGAAVLAVPTDKVDLVRHVEQWVERLECSTDPFDVAGVALCRACVMSRELPLNGFSNWIRSYVFKLEKGDELHDVQIMTVMLSLSLFAETAASMVVPPIKPGTDAAQVVEALKVCCAHMMNVELATSTPPSSRQRLFAVATTLGHLVHVLNRLGDQEVLDSATQKCFDAMEKYQESGAVEPILFSASLLVLDSFNAGFRDDDECSGAICVLCDIIQDSRVDPEVATNIAVVLGSLVNGIVRTDYDGSEVLDNVFGTVTKLAATVRANDGNVVAAAYIAIANLIGANAVCTTTDTLTAFCDKSLSPSVVKNPAYGDKVLALVKDVMVKALWSDAAIRLPRAALIGLSVLCRSTYSSVVAPGAGIDAGVSFRGMPFCKLCFDTLVNVPSAEAKSFSLECLSRCGQLPDLNWSQVLDGVMRLRLSDEISLECARFAESRFVASCESGAGALGKRVAVFCIPFMNSLVSAERIQTLSGSSFEAVLNALQAMQKMFPVDFGKVALLLLQSCARSPRVVTVAKFIVDSCKESPDTFKSSVETVLFNILLELPSPLVNASTPSSACLSPSALQVIDDVSRSLFKLAAQHNAVEGHISQLQSLLTSSSSTNATSSALICAILSAGVACGTVELSKLLSVRRWCATVDPGNAILYTAAVLSAHHLAVSIGSAPQVSRSDRITWLIDTLDTMIFYCNNQQQQQSSSGSCSCSLPLAALICHDLVGDVSYTVLAGMACSASEQHRLAVAASVGRPASLAVLPSLPFELSILINSIIRHRSSSSSSAPTPSAAATTADVSIMKKIQVLSTMSPQLCSLFSL